MRAVLLLVAVLLSAGCLGAGVQPAGVADAGQAFDTSRGWSTPLSPPLYEVLPGVKQLVESHDGVELAIGVFLPDIEGCDWQASALPRECLLPAVMDAGPYYGPNVDVEKFRPPTTEWLVPRGYASVQMSLRGTGESGGCLEYKAPGDVEDISAVIDWIAAQPWSTGNVGMMGRSYDGTSAWAGAASGNPHLKTIVPISGAVNAPLLYYKNGTSETRGVMNGAVYFPTYATDAIGPEDYPQRLCQGALVDVHQESAHSAATGDASSAYWQSRDLRGAILEKYNGSVWVIHGLEDWNVNPSQVALFLNEMQDAGIEVKAWLGVWGHAYPDRVDEHRNVRWDWAERVVQWFDKHLKGAEVDTGPAIEVEDSLFVWRGEASWPPRDLAWQDLALEGSASAPIVGNGVSTASATSEPLEEDLRIAGLPRLHASVTPTNSARTFLFAEMYDVYPDGVSMRIGWGAISLQHAEGGNGAPAVVTPGVPLVAKMEFEPVDALVAKGHRLRVVVHLDGVEDIMASPAPGPVTLDWTATTLSLPVIERPTILPTYTPPALADG